MRRVPFILLTTLLLLTACEKQIDIDIEDMQPQVVVMSQNNADDPVSLTLTYSRPVYGSYYIRNGEDYFQKITDATATLSVNGASSITATRTGNCYTFAYTPQANDQLNLSISVPGHEAVTASATVPHTPVTGTPWTRQRFISEINEYSTDIDEYTICEISVFLPLTDYSSSTNYYSIAMRRYDTVCYTYYDDNGAAINFDTVTDECKWFECQDQLIVNNAALGAVLLEDAVPTFYGEEMLFTDQLINELDHNIELLTQIEFGYYDLYGLNHENTNFSYIIHSTFKIEITSLSRDEYLFLMTLQNYSNDELIGLVSEPVQIHSNIDGGIGIFCIGNKKTITFNVDLQP